MRAGVREIRNVSCAHKMMIQKRNGGGTEFKWAELSNGALIIPTAYSLLWFAKISAGG